MRDARIWTMELVIRDGSGREARCASMVDWAQVVDALARGFDREDAAQRGETDPWSPEFPCDPDWQLSRHDCAEAGLKEVAARLFGDE